MVEAPPHRRSIPLPVLTTGRADLLRIPGLGRFLRWRHSRTVLQSFLLLIAAAVVWDGFTGPPNAPENLAGSVPWLHWRGFALLALLLVGNLFCMACPFMLVRRGGKRLLRGDRIWPAALRTKWVAAGLLILYVWGYEAFDLWASPWWTAWVVVGYFGTAFLIDGLFRGAAFCKYLCPIGQFNFVNGLLSPTEVTVRDPDVCTRCATKDCIKGRFGESGQLEQRGCELYLFQPKKVGNMDCTYCMECVQACPHENVGIVTRSPATELWRDPNRSGVGRFSARLDLAALVIVLCFAGFMNAAGMVAPVLSLQDRLGSALGIGDLAAVSLIFLAGMVALPFLLLSATGWCSNRAGGRPDFGIGKNVARFAYALAPIGFGIWLAHHLYHFLQGALGLIPLAQTFIQRTSGWSVGTPNWNLGPVIPASWLVPLEIGILELGALVSLVVALRIAQRDRTSAQPGSGFGNAAALPWMGLILLLSAVGVWVLLQPMQMRGMMMMGMPG